MQVLAAYASMLEPLQPQQAVTYFCTNRTLSVGVAEALDRQAHTLQMPWQSPAISVDACSSWHQLDLGERRPANNHGVWSRESVSGPRTPSCADHSLMPAVEVDFGSSMAVIMRGLSSIALGTHAVPRVTNGLAAFQAARFGALSQGTPAPLDLGEADNLGTSSTLFTTAYLDAKAQQQNGFAGHVSPPSMMLQCAVRRGQGMQDATARCISMGVTRFLVAGVMLTTALLRMRRLGDMAEAQQLTVGGTLTGSDRQRLHEIRLRGSTSLWGALWQLLKLQMVPVAWAVFYVVIHIDGAFLHACNPSYTSEGILLLIFIWFLPLIASEGLTRIAALDERVGLTSETALTAVISLVTLASSAVGRAYVFEFAVAIAMVRFILLSCTVTATLTLPAHLAAFDTWEPRIGSAMARSRWLSAALCVQHEHGNRGGHAVQPRPATPSAPVTLARARRSAAFCVLVHCFACSDNAASVVVVPSSLLWAVAEGSGRCCLGVLRRAGAIEDSDAATRRTRGQRNDRKTTGTAGKRISGPRSQPSAEDDERLAVPNESETPPDTDDSEAALERITVEQLLAHPEARLPLLRHLRAEFSVEAGLFVIDVWALQDRADTPDRLVPATVARIWQSYVVPGADMGVNLGSVAVRRVEATLRRLNRAGLHMPGTPGCDVLADDSRGPAALYGHAGLDNQPIAAGLGAMMRSIRAVQTARTPQGLAQTSTPTGTGRRPPVVTAKAAAVLPQGGVDGGPDDPLQAAAPQDRQQVTRMLLMAASSEDGFAAFGGSFGSRRRAVSAAARGGNRGTGTLRCHSTTNETPPNAGANAPTTGPFVSPEASAAAGGDGNRGGDDGPATGGILGGVDLARAAAAGSGDVGTGSSDRRATSGSNAVNSGSLDGGHSLQRLHGRTSAPQSEEDRDSQILVGLARAAFDGAQKEVLRMLQVDTFSRFRRTPLMLEAAEALYSNAAAATRWQLHEH